MSLTLKTRKGALIGVLLAVVLTCVAVIFFYTGYHAAHHKDTEMTDTKDANIQSNTTILQLNGRLPRSIEPIVYEVEIFPDIYGNDPAEFTFSGFMKLVFECVNTTSNITLNINKLKLNNDSLIAGPHGANSGTLNGIEITKYSVDTKWQFLKINFKSYLQVGSKYYIQMNFTGLLKTDFAGLYLSTFPHRTRNKHVAATQFSPTDARKAFPNLDEPDRKAEFEITIVRRSDMVSLSNMPLLMTKPKHDNFVADVYQRTPRMSSYLIAFVVGDLVSREIQARPGLNFTAWAGLETINKTETALKIGAKILTFFERYFDIQFPLSKQDILAVPETAVGAMENWGLIIFNENRIYYEKGEYSLQSLHNSARTISHEIAHQWFGNLVTMDWWSNLMLKEGFAMYFEDIGTEHVYPDLNSMDKFAVLKMHKVFVVDGLTTSHPVNMELHDTTQIRQVFDDISYRKGGCMIRMLHFIVGDDTFRNGLKTYLQNYKYRNADNRDLWSAVDEKRPKSVSDLWSLKDVMDTWVLQMNYPVVTLTQTQQGRLKITQKRFLNDGRTDANGTKSSPFHYVWKIPLTYTVSSNITFSHSHKDIIWMNGNELEILDSNLPDLALNGNWVLANIKQWGYYRVNYDVNNWNNLFIQLKNNHSKIHVVNRGQIINDLFSLSKAKLVNLNLGLRSLEYLQQELDYIPWLAAYREILYLDKFIVQTELNATFSKKVIKLISKPLSHFQQNKNNLKMNEVLNYVQLFTLACIYGMHDCLRESREQFKMWKSNESLYTIDVNLRPIVLCSAIRTGDLNDWEYVLKKYNTTYNINKKRSYLQALSCTNNESLQNKLIALTMDVHTIQGQNAIEALRSLALNPSALTKVWNHVTTNWSMFMDKYAGSLFLLDKLVYGITKPFITKTQLSAVEKFLVNTNNLGPAAQAFNQAKEIIKSNIEWLNDNYKTVEVWLNRSGNAI